MPVYDQYEVEPNSAYSGSYLANSIYFITNSLDNNGQPKNTSLITNKRLKIADKATNTVNTGNYNTTLWNYEEAWNIVTKNGQPGRLNRNLNLYSNEIYSDSLIPSPVDIHITNGGKPVFIPFALDFSSPGLVLTPGQNMTASNDGVQISDNIWPYSFPFQSRYKNIQKTLTPSRYNGRIEYGIVGNFSGTVAPTNSEYQCWKFATGPWAYNASLTHYNINSDNINVGWLTTSQSYAYNSLEYYNTVFSQSRETNNNLYLHIGLTVRVSPASGPSAVANASDRDQLDNYFGFGNASPNKFPGFQGVFNLPYYDGLSDYAGNVAAIVPTGSNNSGIAHWTWGNVIRGLKYGLIGSNRTNTKCTYRFGRYGQVRDMLESRPSTATVTPEGIDPYTGLPIQLTYEYPILVSFVSGTTIYTQSRDYVTATNPSYNPYDSGIYDVYYRSGQPFFDRDNED